MAPITVKPRNETTYLKHGFYGFVKWILCIGYCTLLLPISGLWNKTSDLTRGTLKSWYSIIYIPILALQSVKLFIITGELIVTNNRIEAMDRFVNLIVFIANYSMMLLLMRFGLRWNTLVKHIENIEGLLPRTSNQNTVTLVRSLSLMILALEIVDNILTVMLTSSFLDVCLLKTGSEVVNEPSSNMHIFYESFYLTTKSLVFYVGRIVLKFHVNLVYTYTDIIIITMSLYLGSQFKHFNKIMAQKQDLSISRGSASWSSLQVHYTHLSRAVTIIDDSIGPLVLLSFFTNLIYILQQTFFIFNKLMTTDLTENFNQCLQTRYDKQTLYSNSCSALFVLVKTTLVCYYASELHAASREPLNALHRFPTSAFNTDMHRLMSQVYYSDISLTGFKLFRINRKMILGMVGTLLLFELVLFQL